VLVAAAILSLKVYQAPEAPAPAVAVQTVPAVPQSWSLQKITLGNVGSPIARNVRDSSRPHRTTAAPTRYVLDSMPVSYEPSVRF
jgi:hypothetical protein